MGQDDATTGRLRSVGGAALVDHVYALMGTARDGLHGSVTAAYVVGSIANGDDRGPLTDLDLLLVTDRRLDPDVLRATGERLADLAVGSPLRGVEAVLYRHSVLASPTYPLPYELNVNGGPAIARLVATSGTDGFWFLLDVAAAREHALALQGPPAAALIGPVPDAPVVKAVRESLGWHRRKGGDGADVVLNACRAWHWLEHRRWLSKTAAGEWMLAQASAPELVELAVAARRAQRDTRLDADAVRRFVDAVRRRVDARFPPPRQHGHVRATFDATAYLLI
jgi:streptomycin 3"-adenylyltransferase